MNDDNLKILSGSSPTAWPGQSGSHASCSFSRSDIKRHHRFDTLTAKHGTLVYRVEVNQQHVPAMVSNSILEQPIKTVVFLIQTVTIADSGVSKELSDMWNIRGVEAATSRVVFLREITYYTALKTLKLSNI